MPKLNNQLVDVAEVYDRDGDYRRLTLTLIVISQVTTKSTRLK